MAGKEAQQVIFLIYSVPTSPGQRSCSPSKPLYYVWRKPKSQADGDGDSSLETRPSRPAIFLACRDGRRQSGMEHRIACCDPCGQQAQTRPRAHRPVLYGTVLRAIVYRHHMPYCHHPKLPDGSPQPLTRQRAPVSTASHLFWKPGGTTKLIDPQPPTLQTCDAQTQSDARQCLLCAPLPGGDRQQSWLCLHVLLSANHKIRKMGEQ